MNKLILTVIFFLSIGFKSFGQFKKPVYFGLQVRPIFPSNAGGKQITKLTGNDFDFEMQQTIGYSFGGVVRRGITPLIFFESGINFTQRNYNLKNSLLNESLITDDNWSFITYDIPINALVFIKLSRKYYMNTSLGGSLRFSPSSIRKISETGTEHSFRNYGTYTNKIGFNLNANVGFEYRTDRSGSFYLGGSICIPLGGIMDVYSFHKIQQFTTETYVTGTDAGRYISIDLRYFFYNKKNDPKNRIKGPIE